MARFAIVALLLILAVAPTASAEAPGRDSPASAWTDALRGVWSWLFSWVPALRAEPRKAGALIVPSGVQAAPRRAGALIVPSGATTQPPPNNAGGLIVPSG